MAHKHQSRPPLFANLDDVERHCLVTQARRFGLTHADYIRRLIVAAHQGQFVPNLASFVPDKDAIQRGMK